MIKLRSEAFNIILGDVTKVLSILELTESLCHTTKRNFNKVNLLFE